MGIVVTGRGSTLEKTAAGCGVNVSAIKRVNVLDRGGALPAGMALAVPGRERGKAESFEILTFSSPERGIMREEELIACSSFVSRPAQPEQLENLWADGGQTEFCARARRGYALPVLSLRNTEKAYYSPEKAHELLYDNSRESFMSELAEKAARQGWAGLNLDMGMLLPFDREPYSDYVRSMADVLHRRGLWLLCTLPLTMPGEEGRRQAAAYDMELLARSCDRLILARRELSGVETLRKGLRYALESVPAHKLLLAPRGGGQLWREKTQEPESLSPVAAQNLAVCAGTELRRAGKGEPACCDFTDRAGLRCKLSYGDVLWGSELVKLLWRHRIAGLCRSGEGLFAGEDYIFDRDVQGEKLM